MAVVKEILNSEDFEDDSAMAKALIEKIYELFQLRDWYGLQWGPFAYGPYIDKNEAKRASSRMENLPAVHTLKAVSTFAKYVASMEEPSGSHYCPDCEHPTFAHGFTNHVGCVVRKPKPCDCKRMYK